MVKAQTSAVGFGLLCITSGVFALFLGNEDLETGFRIAASIAMIVAGAVLIALSCNGKLAKSPGLNTLIFMGVFLGTFGLLYLLLMPMS